jgi:hypothetical protein
MEKNVVVLKFMYIIIPLRWLELCTYSSVNIVNYNSGMNTTSLHTDDDQIFISHEWKNITPHGR